MRYKSANDESKLKNIFTKELTVRRRLPQHRPMSFLHLRRPFIEYREIASLRPTPWRFGTSPLAVGGDWQAPFGETDDLTLLIAHHKDSNIRVADVGYGFDGDAVSELGADVWGGKLCEE